MTKEFEKTVSGKVRYLKDNHAVLVKDKLYKVYDTVSGGIRVWTDTGFAGIPNGDFKTIEG